MKTQEHKLLTRFDIPSQIYIYLSNYEGGEYYFPCHSIAGFLESRIGLN